MFMSLFFCIASMTRFVEIFRKLFELRLANYTFFQKINILNYVVLLCIELRNIVNRRESDIICQKVTGTH